MKKVGIFAVAAMLVCLKTAGAQTLLPPETDRPFPEPLGTAKGYAPDTNLLAGDCPPCPCRIWASAEYLLWWVKDAPSNFPLLTTTTNAAFVGGLPPGSLGRADTQVLFGGSNFNFGAFSGERITIGGWIDPEGSFGLEGSGFLLDRKEIVYGAESGANGTPQYYIPFYRTDAGRESSFIVSQPISGQGLAGAVNFATTLELWGAEANTVFNVWRTPRSGLVILGGFRYMNLQESLTANTTTGFFSPPPQYDQGFMGFNTLNEFYGAQIGARGYWNFGAFSTELTGKVALGGTYQSVNIAGSDIVTNSPGTAGSVPNGHYSGFVFAQPSNIGHESRGAFSVIPEVILKVGYNITPNVRATVGYDFVYWSNVVRPGDQIDRNINVTQTYGGTLVGPATPTRLFQSSDFFANGLTFGLELRY